MVTKEDFYLFALKTLNTGDSKSADLVFVDLTIAIGQVRTVFLSLGGMQATMAKTM